MNTRISLIILFFLCQSTWSFSQYTTICNVQYQYSIYHEGKPATYYEGNKIGRVMITPAESPYYEKAWSSLYSMNVTFYSGEYLNEVTNRSNYNNSDLVAIIKWSNGGTSIIKMTNYIATSKEIGNVAKGITYKGYDQNNRLYHIKIPE